MDDFVRKVSTLRIFVIFVLCLYLILLISKMVMYVFFSTLELNPF